MNIPENRLREMRAAAREILGPGFVDDYYDQTIVTELRWAYEIGYDDAVSESKRAAEKALEKTRRSA